MKSVHVELGSRSYDIAIGTGLPVGNILKGEDGVRVLIVTDSNVGPLYAERVSNRLNDIGALVTVTTLPAGEETKDLKYLKELYDTAFASGLDRSSVIVALGGGVIGDIAGFLAATLLRGVRVIQMPTSLLALVDSSVGGKTGINVPQGKNLVGSFYQPIEVVADLELLSSLPEREYISGLSEVVKYGVIYDLDFFEMICAQVELISSRDPQILEDIVERCCQIKADVVSKDEKESGLRSILNFGHTLGHAIEKVSGYGKCLHGEAVSLGMIYAAEISVRSMSMPELDRDRLVSLLRDLGLPVSLKDIDCEMDFEQLREAMRVDKKTCNEVTRFVLAQSIGVVEFGCEVDESTLKDAYEIIEG